MQNEKWRKRMRHRSAAASVAFCILHFDLLRRGLANSAGMKSSRDAKEMEA
ncbi:MAG TPA: hypothetical protein VFI31_18120 [Pirellulales bacterium]|nr:hypothetical protein [Pirellulales bacterium]